MKFDPETPPVISARQKKAQAKSLNSGLEIGAVASLMRQIREQRRLAELCRGQTPALVTGRRLPPPPGELAARSGGRRAGGEERGRLPRCSNYQSRLRARE